ncbi:MAG: hypothetical protein AAFQ94_24425 [Bacteroidota bacterium]
MQMKLKWWWYILPAYLTLWTIIFSIWNVSDPEGMMNAFQIDTGGATTFILLNSAARYLAIAVGMVVGIWIFRTFQSILTVLLIRLMMDFMDLYAGLQSEIIKDFSGVLQSALMFLIPNLVSIFFLIRSYKNQRL